MENLKIGEFELDEIEKWLNSYKLPRSHKKHSRDFNDGVLVANIIKLEFPKIVDLHNYPSSSSFNQKFCNWETLNRKVLVKLGINLSLNSCGLLARGANQDMLRFLFELKNKIQDYKIKCEREAGKIELMGGGSCPAVMMQTQDENLFEKLPNEIKSHHVFKEIGLKYQEKLEEIKSLKEYIFQLEKKIYRKTEEISSLKIEKHFQDCDKFYYE